MEKIDESGLGFVHENLQSRLRYTKMKAALEKKADSSEPPTARELEEPTHDGTLNWKDLAYFIKNGGKVKELMNMDIYNRVCDQLIKKLTLNPNDKSGNFKK